MLICWAPYWFILLCDQALWMLGNYHLMKRMTCICWLRLDATLLYAFQLIHALLILLNQTVNVTLKLPDFCELCVETHLKFWVCLVEILLTVLCNYRLYRHHLDVESPCFRKVSLFAENDSWACDIIIRAMHSGCLLKFSIVLKYNLNLPKVTHFNWTLIRLADLV